MIDDFVINELNKINELKIIIDVGCHMGELRSFLLDKLNGESYWVGIDAIEYPPIHGAIFGYDKLIYKAVSNVGKEETRKFYKFAESGCNSLLERNMDGYIGQMEEDGFEEVTVDSLENILNELEISNIHFLCIDTQGSDINVVKSLGKYISKVNIIQIESISNQDSNKTLYKGQSLMKQDIETMKNLGFELIKIIDHNGTEADVIFKRK